MAITYPRSGVRIGYYIYKQHLDSVVQTGSAIGAIPCYSQVTPLVGTLYASRDAARRAARKLNDKLHNRDRNSAWSYDWDAAYESDRHLFRTVPQTVTR